MSHCTSILRRGSHHHSGGEQPVEKAFNRERNTAWVKWHLHQRKQQACERSGCHHRVCRMALWYSWLVVHIVHGFTTKFFRPHVGFHWMSGFCPCWQSEPFSLTLCEQDLEQDYIAGLVRNNPSFDLRTCNWYFSEKSMEPRLLDLEGPTIITATVGLQQRVVLHWWLNK